MTARLMLPAVPAMRLLALLAVALAWTSPAAAARAARTSEKPAEVKIVKTWKDLLDQPAIELKGAFRMRVGVEAAACPAGGGVLLYGLTEAYFPGRGGTYIPPSWEGGPAHPMLGPCAVKTIFNGASTFERLGGWERLVYTGKDDPGEWPLLFVFPIIPRDGGAYRLELRSPDKKGSFLKEPFTELNFQTTEEAFHSFSTLGPWNKLSDVVESGPAGELGAIGWPAWNFVYPANLRKQKDRYEVIRPDPEQALPTFLPAEPNPNLELRLAAGGQATLVSQNEILVSNYPKHLLTRWWINGQPYVPRLKLRQAQDPTPPQAGQEVQIPVDARQLASLLGAKKGDRIAFQLLYCEYGWTEVPFGNFREQSFQRDPAPRLSNRVEWVVK